jgi:hypothetical protein
MKKQKTHIISSQTLKKSLSAVFICVLFLINPDNQVYAQNSNLVQKLNSAISFFFPTNSTNNKSGGTEIASKKSKENSVYYSTKAESDSINFGNKINKLYSKNDKYTVEIELATESEIDVAIYNMLGKEVLRLSSNEISPAKKGISEIEFDSSKLPLGHYLCVLSGSNFRSAYKFVISR